MYTYSTSDVLFLTVELTELNYILFLVIVRLLLLGDLFMKHFAVTAKFGHVGRGNYIPKTIAISTENGREAAFKVRWMPRVKHHRKDAIMDVKKISDEEYLKLKEENINDPYFKVSSKQEQAKLCSDLKDSVLQCEEPNIDLKKRKAERDKKIKFKMRKNKQINNYAIECMRNYEVMMSY